MRYIAKKLSHSPCLNTLHSKQRQKPTNKAEAERLWESDKLDKEKILSLLLWEQYYLCGYSEIRADEYELDYHIEHVENKSQNPPRTFDYENLLASAIHSKNLDKIPLKDRFGGHAIGKMGRKEPIDMVKFISPFQKNCYKFFIYLSNGKILPHKDLDEDEQKKAEYTIDILNLNSPFLQIERKNEYEKLKKLLDEYDSSFEVLKNCIEIELVPRKHKLESFFSLKRQFFNQFLGCEVVENILQGYKNGILK